LDINPPFLEATGDSDLGNDPMPFNR